MIKLSNYYIKLANIELPPAENMAAAVLKRLASEYGDMPNIPMKTKGGETWWDTVLEGGGLRLQVNKIFGSARILDENNRRLAWGSHLAMRAKIKKLMRSDFLQAGDIIGVRRPLGYEHYAVYIGSDRVIHFAADGSDFGKPYIHEAPISDFLLKQENFFVLDFSAGPNAPEKIYKGSGRLNAFVNTIAENDVFRDENAHLYSPEETVKRAKSVIGANEHSFRSKYNLVFNNCEHFAIWCKTGIATSYQVESIIGSVMKTDLGVIAQGLKI